MNTFEIFRIYLNYKHSIIEGILSLFVLAIPYFGWIIFHIIAAIALIFAGIKYIVSGIFGDVYKLQLPKALPDE
jgi:hypothetical protein